MNIRLKPKEGLDELRYPEESIIVLLQSLQLNANTPSSCWFVVYDDIKNKADGKINDSHFLNLLRYGFYLEFCFYLLIMTKEFDDSIC